MEALAKLKPVFKSGGTTAAMHRVLRTGGRRVVMAREKALTWDARFATVRSCARGIDMKLIPRRPDARNSVLKKKASESKMIPSNQRGLAGSTVTVIRELGIDMDKVNVVRRSYRPGSYRRKRSAGAHHPDLRNDQAGQKQALLCLVARLGAHYQERRRPSLHPGASMHNALSQASRL